MIKGIVSCLLVFAFASAALAGEGAATNVPADLPMTRAVMFSSGVGYFEHAGIVEDDASVRLMFDRGQMDDVLKSMIVLDEDGGTVTHATYPTRDPIERTLSGFAVDLSNRPTLPQLLEQLRGSSVTVHAPEAITGRILSVEQRERVMDRTTITEHLVTLATGDGMTTVVLDHVDRVRLEDAGLQRELSRALDTLAGARDSRRRPVTLRFEGEGRRRVRVGYLVETPVWKTSYRLDLSEAGPSAGASGEGETAEDRAAALLQGWGMVENMTESDWRDIQLSLVSGQPISYTMDLYTPLYVDRPRVEIPRYSSLKPRLYGEGMTGDEGVQELAQARGEHWQGAAQAPRPMAESMVQGSRAADAGAARGMALQSSLDATARPQARAASVGELFRFTLDNPVSLDRRQSAMLPIVSERVEAGKVSIYNGQTHREHPMSGVELTNSTGLKLLAGPVTVLDGGMYAGDALIDHMTPHETRLLSYAVDLSVTVDPSSGSTQQVLSGKIVRGVLHVTRRQGFSQTYRVRNKADEKRVLIIEHPYDSSRQLVEPEEPYEKTPEWYRFRVPVAADTTGELTVREQRTYSQSIALLERSDDELLRYSKSGNIDDDVREALEEAAAMKNELSRLQRERQQKHSQLNEITGGQERLRRNIDTVGRESTLGKRYVGMLAEQEDQVEALRRELAELDKRVRAQEEKLADYLQSLNVSP